MFREAAAVLVPILTASAPGSVLAHAPGAAGTWWWSWTLTPFVVIATAFVLWLYARGAAHASRWQRAGFVAGSGLLFLALQSPLDALADDSFAAHQLQHLVIHALAPP